MADCRRRHCQRSRGQARYRAKTADNHIQSLYSKIGVATRACAALFNAAGGLLGHHIVVANGGSIVDEEYFPLEHFDYRETVRNIEASGAEVVFNTTVPRGLTPFLEQLCDSGFAARGGKLVCTYFDENFLNMAQA
jgi:hypothetical protein